MNYLDKKERLDYLLELIEKERCNTLDCISEKFGISKSTSKRLISILREKGFKIHYSRFAKKYFLQ